MKRKIKPHQILLILAIVLGLISIFNFKSGQLYEISLTDTYYVVSPAYVFGLISLAGFMIWIPYVTLKRLKHANTMTWIHVLCSTALILAIVVLIQLSQHHTNELPERYLEEKNDYTAIISTLNYNKLTFKVISAFLLIQLVLVFNIIGTYLRQNKLKKHSIEAGELS